MNGPLGKALIAHLESVFIGPNGDYSAVMENLDGLSARQALWAPAKGGNSAWRIVDHLTTSKQWLIDLLEKGSATAPPWSEPAGGEKAWQEAVARLRETHFRLQAALERLADFGEAGYAERSRDHSAVFWQAEAASAPQGRKVSGAPRRAI